MDKTLLKDNIVTEVYVYKVLILALLKKIPVAKQGEKEL